MQLVRTVYQDVVDEVWGKCVVDGQIVDVDATARQARALDVVRGHLIKLEEKALDLKEFVYTKGLTSKPAEYKNQNTPHVQVSELVVESSVRAGSMMIINEEFGPWHF